MLFEPPGLRLSVTVAAQMDYDSVIYSTGRMIQFLQQIKKKKEREGIRLRTKSDLKVPTSIMCDL